MSRDDRIGFAACREVATHSVSIMRRGPAVASIRDEQSVYLISDDPSGDLQLGDVVRFVEKCLRAGLATTAAVALMVGEMVCTGTVASPLGATPLSRVPRQEDPRS